MGEKQSRGRKVLKTVLTVLVCLAIFATAAGALALIYTTEPEAGRAGAIRRSAALVETISTRRGSYRPRMAVLGRVEPAQDILLSPRVGGQIVEIDPGFVPGGLVEAGDLMLRIDPADFETALRIRQSELRQARADLTIEQGRQSVARQEFALLEQSIDPANRALVLREPQIESIRAQVASAEAAVRRAELDLERTRITAPFDAQILHRTVNVGSQVAPGDELARLVGTDEYWVMATVPQRDLPWIQFPIADEEGSRVRLANPGTWPVDRYRDGRVTRMIGTVDEQTRLARVLVTVPDPLSRETDGPPLVLGTLLETQIEGRPIDDVVRLERDYVRENDTVWVMTDGKLDIRETEIIFRDTEYAYIRDGLDDGEAVVTTTLATIAEGIPLRRAGDEGDADAEGEP